MSDAVFRVLEALKTTIPHPAHQRVLDTLDTMIRFPLPDEIPVLVGLPGAGKSFVQRACAENITREYGRSTAAIVQRLHESPKPAFDWATFHRNTLELIGHPHTARNSIGDERDPYYRSNRWKTAAACARDVVSALQKRKTIALFLDEFHEILQCSSNTEVNIKAGPLILAPEDANEVTSTLNIFKGFADDLTSPTTPDTHSVRVVLASTYSIADTHYWGNVIEPWANHLRRRLVFVHYAPYSLSDDDDDVDYDGYGDLLDTLQEALSGLAPQGLLRENATLLHEITVGLGGETISLAFRAARSLLSDRPGSLITRDVLIRAAKPESQLSKLRLDLQRGLQLLKDQRLRQDEPNNLSRAIASSSAPPDRRSHRPGKRNPSRDPVR